MAHETFSESLINLYIASGDFDVTPNQLSANLGPHYFDFGTIQFVIWTNDNQH
jgi:hypothetical protein